MSSSSCCAIHNLNALFAPPSSTRKNVSIPSSVRRNVLSVKALGANGRDSLDHLQRVVKTPPPSQQQQQQQQAPKRRVPQSNPIGLWDRFPSARTVQQMMDTMDRIMEDPFAYGYAPRTAAGDENVGSYRRGRTPWEIKEGKGEYRMRFDMPGMTRKDVKVLVEERMLVVRAEKVNPEQAEEEKKEGEGEGTWWPAESYGRYNTRIALPENVEVEKIKAEVKDGVLYITVPKVMATSKVLDIDVQ